MHLPLNCDDRSYLFRRTEVASEIIRHATLRVRSKRGQIRIARDRFFQHDGAFAGREEFVAPSVGTEDSARA